MTSTVTKICCDLRVEFIRSNEAYRPMATKCEAPEISGASSFQTIGVSAHGEVPEDDRKLFETKKSGKRTSIIAKAYHAKQWNDWNGRSRRAFRGPRISRKEIWGLPEFEIGIEDVPLQSDPVLSEALKAALRFLRAEGRQDIDEDAEQIAAAAILFEWLAGTLHSVRLANAGIVAVWQAQSSTPIPPERVAFLRERFFDS